MFKTKCPNCSTSFKSVYHEGDKCPYESGIVPIGVYHLPKTLTEVMGPHDKAILKRDAKRFNYGRS